MRIPVVFSILLSFAALGAAPLCPAAPAEPAEEEVLPEPVDATVAPETRHLLRNLHRTGWDPHRIMFGQEFPLSYSLTGAGITDPSRSDVADVVGDHPAVHGSDFHFLLDKDQHEIVSHTLAAKAAYGAGALVTFDFHWLGKYGQSHNWHRRDARLLYNVVRGDNRNGDVTWFYESLDAVLRIVNEELGFPVVFRPFHEMNGNWFWWGSRAKGGPETYRRAFQLMVEYLSEHSEYFLFCWSPDKALATEYYPGDEYVDIIGIDGYGQGNPRVDWFTVEDMVSLLEEVTDFAAARGKVAAFTETGHDTTPRITYPETQPDWWTKSVLEPILASEKASRIAWILTWVNSSPWSGPYTPWSGAPEAAKADFRKFHEHPATLFQAEAARLKLYEAPRD